MARLLNLMHLKQEACSWYLQSSFGNIDLRVREVMSTP